MAVHKYNFLDSPKSAQLTSSFRRDERCVEVDLIMGPDYDEVYELTKKFFNLFTDIIDFDVNYDNVSSNWVGVTCKDV